MKLSTVNQSPVLITGAPRSGTSWLGELLSRARGVRYVYEPFNPQWNSSISGALRHFEYLSSGSTATSAIEKASDRAFAGRQTRQQLARAAYRGYLWPTIRPFDRVLVKDPTSVLMSEWIAARYDARVLIVTRHPCAFASSIMLLGWRLDNTRFLSQPRLMAEYLAPYESVIRQASGDSWTRVAATWSIIHLVLQKQFQQNPAWLMCKYEDICTDQVSQLAVLTDQLGMSYKAGIESSIGRDDSFPSDDPGSTQKATKEMPEIWRSRLTPGQIDSVTGVVHDFGLSHLYGESLS